MKQRTSRHSTFAARFMRKYLGIAGIWVGSAKDDLLRFPEAVKDEIGTALSVAQFGKKHAPRSRGRARGRAFWRLWRTIVTIPIVPFAWCVLRR